MKGFILQARYARHIFPEILSEDAIFLFTGYRDYATLNKLVQSIR